MPDTELLIEELEARDIVMDGWHEPTVILTPDERDSLIATVKQLRSELADEKRLRAELKQIAQTGIAEVSSVGTTLGEIALRDFRSRAVDLCNQKAAEYEESAEQFKHDDRLRLCLSSKREAYKAMAVELGKLT